MEVFLNLFSNDEQLREIAHKTVMKKIEDPNFIFELFDIFVSQLSQGINDALLKSICIVIFKILQTYWNAESYFDDSHRQEIYQRLLKSIFLLPFNIRSILETSLFDIFIPLSIASEMLPLCIEQFNHDSLENIATSINIISHYFEYHKNDGILESYISFVNFLIPYIYKFVDELRNNNVVAISIILSNICYLFNIFPQSITTIPNFMDLLSSLISCFSIPHSSSQLRISICDLFSQLPMTIDFDPQLISAFSSCILDFLKSKPNEPTLCAKCFSIIDMLISNINELFDAFINPSTLEDVFIINSLLTLDDLSTFNEIPEQFVAFCYDLEEQSDNEITPRIAIAKIFKTICKKYNDQVDTILNYCLEKVKPEMNPTELESILFIISCIISSSPFNMDVYQLSINIIFGTFPPFVMSTAICILQYMKIDPIEMNKLSLQMLISSPYDVIKILSIYLFENTFRPPNTKIETPFPEILTALLNLSISVKDSKPVMMLQKLICQFSDEFESFAGQFIAMVIEMWLNLQGTIDESDGSRLLQLLTRCIQKTPQNSEILLNTIGPIFDFCCNALSSFSESLYLSDFLDIIFCLIDKIDLLPPDSFAIIPFLAHFISSNLEENVCLIEDITKIFICLSQKSTFIEHQENIENILTFSQLILSTCQNGEQISSIFYLLSSTLQVMNQNPDQFAQIAIDNISRLIDNSLVDTTILSSIYLLSTCLIVDASLVLPLLNESIIDFVLCNLQVFKNADFNKIKVIFIAFVILSKFDNSLFYQASINFLHIFSEQNNENDEFFEDDFEYHEYQHEIFDSFPFDTLDYESFILELTKNQKYFSELPEEEQHFVQSHCHIKE